MPKTLTILRLMGCTSNQYASMERYLVLFSQQAREHNYKVYIAYNSRPASHEFCSDLKNAGAYIISLHLPHDTFSFLQLLPSIDILHSYFSPASHLSLFFSAIAHTPVRIRTAPNAPLSVISALQQYPTRNFLSRLFYTRLLLSLRLRLSALLSHAILTTSHAVATELIMLGVPEKKIFCIPGGIDTSHYTPPTRKFREISRKQFNLDSNTIAIGFAGRFVPLKNLALLLDAFTSIAEQSPNAHLFLAGDGPLKQSLQQQYSHPRIHFLGHIPHLKHFYSALDIYVHPSFAEGMSNAIMEAGACGIPLILSSIPPHQSLIQQGAALGISEPPLKSLQNILHDLLSSSSLRTQLGNAAHQYIIDHHSVHTRIQKELMLYEQLFKTNFR